MGVRYFVCLTLGLTVAAMIRVGFADPAEQPVDQQQYGIRFRSWEPHVECMCSCDEAVRLSVLVEPSQIWIGTSRINEFVQIPGQDWNRLDTELRALKTSAFFVDREDIELAVEGTPEHPITHGTLVTAMSLVQRAGFRDIQLTPAAELAASPYHHDDDTGISAR